MHWFLPAIISQLMSNFRTFISFDVLRHRTQIVGERIRGKKTRVEGKERRQTFRRTTCARNPSIGQLCFGPTTIIAARSFRTCRPKCGAIRSRTSKHFFFAFASAVGSSSSGAPSSFRVGSSCGPVSADSSIVVQRSQNLTSVATDSSIVTVWPLRRTRSG